MPCPGGKRKGTLPSLILRRGDDSTVHMQQAGGRDLTRDGGNLWAFNNKQGFSGISVPDIAERNREQRHGQPLLFCSLL